MGFEITLTQDGDAARGEITLGEGREDFAPCLTHFSIAQYRSQWQRALRLAVIERQSAALFQSIEIDTRGYGTIWMYPLVPSDDVNGVYVTERFMPIVVHPELLLERRYEEYDDGTIGPEIMSYFLDLRAPERFFGYMDDTVAGISNWYYPNGDFPL